MAHLFFADGQGWLLSDHLWSFRAHLTSGFKDYGFAWIAVLVSAILVAWSSGMAWSSLSSLRNDFGVVQSESYHLAEHIEEKMLALARTLRCLGAPPNPVAMAEFRRQIEEMKLWLQSNRQSVACAQQRDLLDQIETALNVYVVKTALTVDENMRAATGTKPKPVFAQMRPEASQVLALGRELRAAEQAALQRLVKESWVAMGVLRMQGAIAAAAALALGLAGLHLMHVARITPLSARLLRSHSILEQQERLTLLGTFAAGVAHEVRSALTAIRIRLHGLQRALPTTPSANQDVSFIEGGIERLERLVEDILQFPHETPPQMQVLAAVTLFDQLTSLLGPQLKAAGIRCQVEAPPGVCVRADPQQLQQVVIDLIQNAVENTARGGTIT
ncbi:MAG: hypothetical protein NT154_30290, partial [Verrucomicrobia bacterium]|nr:hypothetical protein [Verrucomicrobiota bacterium]